MSGRRRTRAWFLVLGLPLVLVLVGAGVLGVGRWDAAMAARDERRMDALALELRGAIHPGLSADEAIRWLESRGLPHSSVMDATEGWPGEASGLCPYVVRAAIRPRYKRVMWPVERQLLVEVQLGPERVVRGLRVEESVTAP